VGRFEDRFRCNSARLQRPRDWERPGRHKALTRRPRCSPRSRRGRTLFDVRARCRMRAPGPRSGGASCQRRKSLLRRLRRRSVISRILWGICTPAASGLRTVRHRKPSMPEGFAARCLSRPQSVMAPIVTAVGGQTQALHFPGRAYGKCTRDVLRGFGDSAHAPDQPRWDQLSVDASALQAAGHTRANRAASDRHRRGASVAGEGSAAKFVTQDDDAVGTPPPSQNAPF